MIYFHSNSRLFLTSRTTSMQSYVELRKVRLHPLSMKSNRPPTLPIASFLLHFPIGEPANLPHITKCHFTRNVRVIEFRIRTNENSLRKYRSCKR